MKFLKITIVFLFIFSISCNREQEPDIALIEIIENSLLPAVLLEGQEDPGMNIHERMEHYRVPGLSIAFLNDGKISWAKGYGYTSADSTRPVDKHTLFQAASISKPVAAIAALKLVEDGKIGLDEDVNLYLKDWQVEENGFTVEEKVTLRRILSHSAGLTVHGFAGYTSDEEVPDLVQVLNGEEPANSARIYPDTTPGVEYSYSGGGYTIMQKLLCDITAKAFPDLMEETVLSKIGMQFSTYEQPLPDELWENAAYAHNAEGEIIEGRWHTYPEMAAAGLWTTPSDLLRYAIEVQESYFGKSNKILSRDMVHEMLTPRFNNHALGPGTGGSGDSIIFSHGGSNRGFRCGLLAFTRQGEGLAIMTNGARGGELIAEIRRSFSASYGWNYNPAIRSLFPMNKDELESLTGRYLLNIQGEELVLELIVLDNHLKGTQLWNEFSFEIYPESPKRFFNRDDNTDFVFSSGENESIKGVTIYEGSREYFFRKL
jgi:CubicO group peptidase (beta-lactamase class C family)